MAFANVNKAAVVAAHARSDSDTGSPKVQIALMTHRIDELAKHALGAPTDLGAQRGLKKIVARRRSMLDYLKGRDASLRIRK